MHPAPIRLTLAAGLSLLVCGAALAQSQPISISTKCVDGKPVVGASCTLKLGSSEFNLITPGQVMIPKSTEDLSVTCNKGQASASGVFASRRNGGTWGKLAAWGGMEQMLSWPDLNQLDYPKDMSVVLIGDCAR
jgi:hypothetical protein